MAQVNGGQALIQALDQAGIRLVLGVPGVGQYEPVDAMYQHPRLRYLSLRHEQAAGYMADGYCRAGGEPAALLVVPGPGLLNAGAGIVTAAACSSAMLVITGADRRPGKQSISGSGSCEVSPVLHSLTKWSGRANTVQEIPGLVTEAVSQARRGRPGPVGLEIPHSVFAARAEAPAPITLPTFEEPSRPDLVQRSVELMAQAQRPLIWAGGGVMRAGAWRQVAALAERWRAPVVTTRSGKGALSDRHPLALGYVELRYPPLRQLIEAADVILAIGVSQDLSKFPAQLVRVDIDPAVVSSASGVGIVGDAATVLDDLLGQTAPLAPARPQLEREVAALNAARFDPARQLQPQSALTQAMRAALPDETVVVQGMNQLGYYSRNYWPTYAPRAYLTSSSLSTLGAAWPIALGAKLGAPERPVVALCGDGGFLYNVQELATAVQAQIPAIAVVFNDNAYGNVLRAQQEQFTGREIGTRLHNPDFVALAQSFGVWAVRADGADELGDALTDALAETAGTHVPALIEVPVGAMQREY